MKKIIFDKIQKYIIITLYSNIFSLIIYFDLRIPIKYLIQIYFLIPAQKSTGIKNIINF